ncbi:nucleotide-binding universal stress UspA family protein [Arcicella aurantiaca]|uniref:Nucleotide-binding universal stress UspA family protein n=1 Tax=Arcicella aurantiaca TaxID=591202 RepID=A0A316ECT0_9BACT|nr:universal stress protein [Arcicella aurantiaca]PWK28682.1 nucleotide-binding universal stress UspA family protein [Arcicella aurantiaca]
MKTILFPTDFSTNAIHASQYAGMLARRLNAKVVLLNIYSVPTVSEYQLPYEIENFILQNRKDAEKNLQDFTAKFIEATSLVSDRITQMVEYGFVGDKINEIAKQINASLIVMGTKGASNAIDKWLGTHSQKVMKNAPCPVWIVPENAAINYPKNIIYAADFKEDEVIATQKVLEFAKPLEATCNIVHIHDYFELNVSHAVQEMVHYLEDEFEKEDVSVHNVNRADIISGLETYIRTHKPDVLALAIHEKSFLEKIFDTSVTKHFVQEAKLPILTFRK